MKRTLAALAALPLALSLAACGGGDDKAAAPTPAPVATESATPSASPTPTPTEAVDPYAPNIDDRALRAGQWRSGQSIRTKIHEVKRLTDHGSGREPAAGNIYYGLNIEQCVRKSSAESYYATLDLDWSLIASNGYQYRGDGSSWNDWPAPRFPDQQEVMPGRCVRGWIEFEVANSAKITSVLYAPDGNVVAEWLPRKGDAFRV